MKLTFFILICTITTLGMLAADVFTDQITDQGRVITLHSDNPQVVFDKTALAWMEAHPNIHIYVSDKNIQQVIWAANH